MERILISHPFAALMPTNYYLELGKLCLKQAAVTNSPFLLAGGSGWRGRGNVGEAIAYTLMVRVQANDIVLVDLNEDRAEGAALDIAHGTSFLHRYG